MKIAFVGTGVMGQGMVANLLKAGHEVTVYTRTKAKADGLLALGAKWASSPAESARGADIAISMVGYPSDVEEVWRGPQGFMFSAKPGCMLIDMTTSSPALARSLAAEATAKGFGPLDAPVSGGDRGAREGTLTIMAGGAQQDFDFAQPVFAAMGKTIVLQGAPGTGQLCKLANQIGIASGMIAMAEALAFARATGLNLETTLRSISGGGASSWALLNLAPRVLKGDFAPGFYVKHFVKDIGLALDVCREQKVSLPGLELAAKLYAEVVAAGEGDAGTQALARLYFSR
ncbi:MAG: NAD(P)-dependent oxidoreductase [Verrucomicrobia bacterium]|nr:MAG: NAD(P)-dependent oxidoreductase [Verrucomicrobiota bacterium]